MPHNPAHGVPGGVAVHNVSLPTPPPQDETECSLQETPECIQDSPVRPDISAKPTTNTAHTIIIDATTQVQGDNNIVSIDAALIGARAASAFAELSKKHMEQMHAHCADPSSCPAPEPLSVELRCGLVVTGERNVVGGSGATRLSIPAGGGAAMIPRGGAVVAQPRQLPGGNFVGPGAAIGQNVAPRPVGQGAMGVPAPPTCMPAPGQAAGPDGQVVRVVNSKAVKRGHDKTDAPHAGRAKGGRKSVKAEVVE